MKIIVSNMPLRVVAEIVLIVMSVFGTTSQAQDARRIEVVAKRFEFTPSQITLKKGEPVVLAFRSDDVAHSIVVKELNIKADIQKGRTAEVRITPQITGDFVGKCGHFCGSGHGRMQLVVHVD